MKRKAEELDLRIKKKHTNWFEYSITFFVLSVLSAGQAMIFMSFIGGEDMPIGFVLGMIGYWAIVALIFTLVTNAQIANKFEKPMHMLSAAAKEVAAGDFSVYVEPIHTKDKHDYVDVMFTDFNTMVEKLGRVEILQSDLLTNVSHEIRTPVSVIQSYAQLLKTKGITDEEKETYADTILDATRNLSSLMTNILNLSRLENDDTESVQSYDLCRQLTECILHFEDALDKKEINLTVDMEDRAMLLADKEKMEIIWDSLLSNAIKFTESGGDVTLTQKTAAGVIVVTISDTGRGMRKDEMDQMFDKFYQGDTSHSEKGNGLGLTLAAKALERVGGTMSVTSTVGKGSTFAVELPAL